MSERIVVEVCWNDGSLGIFDGGRIEDRGTFVVLFRDSKSETWIRRAATRWYSVRREEG